MDDAELKVQSCAVEPDYRGLPEKVKIETVCTDRKMLRKKSRKKKGNGWD